MMFKQRPIDLQIYGKNTRRCLMARGKWSFSGFDVKVQGYIATFYKSNFAIDMA